MLKQKEYCFDVSISQEGDLCDLLISPVSMDDSRNISGVTASIIQAMSLHGGIRVSEVRDYTQEEQGSYAEEDVEKVAAYLQQHVLADLEQITLNLGMDPAAASLSLHRLIDKGTVGFTRIGTNPVRLFYYK